MWTPPVRNWYDGRGWRFRKRIGNSGPATLYHYSPDGLLLAEVGPSNQIIAEYVYLEGVPLALASGGGLYYIHANHLGAPVAMTDASQAVVWQASYDPFGRATVTSAGPTLNLRLPGQYFDAETGLYYNMARHYDPGTGRYLQSDPIGLDGGINTYAYVGNNPIIKTDFTGLLENFTLTLNKQAETRLECECEDKYMVFSGQGDGLNNPDQIANTDIGPIPLGEYYIVDRMSGGRLGGIYDFGRSLMGNDPNSWFALLPKDGNTDDCRNVNGVIRCGFRMHPGEISKGCITFRNFSEFYLLREKLLKTQKGIIPGTNTQYYGTVTVQ